MNRKFNKIFSVITILALMLMALPMQNSAAAGTVSLTTLGSAYTQDFNTLANSPDNGTSTTVPTGWEFSESGTNANTTYRIGTGSSNTGDTYSFGTVAGNTDRAFGGLRSGSLVPLIGAQFTNNTGGTITSLDISYTGEQWRLGQNASGRAADRLDFQLSTNATSLTTGTWADYDSLDFSSPVVAGTVGALNGNVSPNRTALSFSIVGLSIANGANFWLRWADTDLIPGADDGLSVDDFSLIPNGIADDQAPAVTDTYPDDGATDFPTGADLTVTFSEPVNVLDPWFDLTCSTSGTVTATATGGPTTFTINPDVNLVHGENCAFTVLASQITDQDSNDPPDNMVVNFVAGFSPYDACAVEYTPIYQIQGSGSSAAVTGNVTTQGVVVGDFEGPTFSGIQGFYLQDATGDGNAATSDGIFVFTGDTNNNLNAGDMVRVTGYARERFNQTALNGSNDNSSAVPAGNIINCGSSSVAPVDVTMPFESSMYLERFEGMLVRFPQSLVISEYFNYDRFGEIVLGLPLDGETRHFTPTSIVEPGAVAQARAQAYSLRRITLDDRLGSQNPSVTRHPNGDPFSLSNRFRGGDTVTNTVGVLGFDFNLYRIQPTGPADYTELNPRPAAPEEVGGNVSVAAMNTLNFFLTLDTTASDSVPGPCGGNQNLDCRGADSNQPQEFTRQRDKLLAALSGLGADVIGLNELENTPGVDPLGDPTRGIVAGLNAMLGAGTYSYINTGVIGTDAIRVGLIYKPGAVTPVGDFKILNSTVDPRFLDTKSRPALAQTFEEVATGARFTVVVNHLKSKGSDCNDVGDPDTGDGQGNCNQTRKKAAQALVDWIATDPTGSGDADYIIMGDLNSYAQEDPIDAIKSGADDTAGTFDDYTNLIFQYQGTYAYSYVFDGQAGYLDHALSFPSLTAQVTGAADWHINADEPDLLDYDTSFKSNAQDALYEPNAYRSSDHDALIVGLDPLHYNFNGFFHPIDNAPTVNSVKAGQAVPIKFSLGGDQGLDIFFDGYPNLELAACEPGSADPVEETSAASNPGLTYDPATDQYTYVWKTEKGWANKCGTLTIVLDDGSIHKILFKFTK